MNEDTATKELIADLMRQRDETRRQRDELLAACRAVAAKADEIMSEAARSDTGAAAFGVASMLQELVVQAIADAEKGRAT